MARNQPTYDLLTGAPLDSEPASARQVLRETFRQSQAAKFASSVDPGNEELRAQVNALQYELESLKQERELTNLRTQQETRDAQTKADAEFRRAQEAESSKKLASNKQDALSRELSEVQTSSANEKASLEKKIRALQERGQQLQEEAEEANSELQSVERQGKHRYDDLETRFNSVQASFNELQADLEARTTALQATQQKLAQKETEAGNLESEIIALKGQNGGSDELVVVKGQLSDQVAHIKKLDKENREHLAQLNKYQKAHKSVQVVEEEKRTLEGRLRALNDLQHENNELRLKNQALVDERSAWASYLESEASSEGKLHFESPEELARAFVRERLETAALLNQLGALKPDLAVKEGIILALENEKAILSAELDQLRAANTTMPVLAAPASDSKLRTRLERQRNLAVKEAEYLRAQLKTFDMEESGAENYDVLKAQRIQELEDLIEQYRTELQTVHQGLTESEERNKGANMGQLSPTSVSSARKRPLADNVDERVGELTRKHRKLQNEILALQKTNMHLAADLKASTAQVSSLKSTSRTRILELRQNPTAQTEAIKLGDITNLRTENTALLERLAGKTNDLNSVPTSSLLRSQSQITELERTIADRDKRMLRLKQIWSAKALEFREAVASLLGWKMDFMPNGRVRVTSMFYPGDEETGENSIVFDGEKGEMKVSGGPQSAFASEIGNELRFWVDERKEIPGFLAALTMQFWEKKNGDGEHSGTG